MKVKDIIKKLNLKVLSGENKIENDIEGVYINDLLSYVMAHGNKNNIWITVQIHPNIVAVASLAEFSCIIIPENISVEKITVEKAEQEGICILQSTEDAYTICGRLKEVGI